MAAFARYSQHVLHGTGLPLAGGAAQRPATSTPLLRGGSQRCPAQAPRAALAVLLRLLQPAPGAPGSVSTLREVGRKVEWEGCV